MTAQTTWQGRHVIVSGTPALESYGSQPGYDPGGLWVTSEIETPWLRASALGGFGRRKQQQAETPQPAEVPAAAPAAATTPADAGALMVMESEMVSYTSQPVDASRFAVPGGFKQVKSEMEKLLEK